jgi:2-polyprenyl-3-methyl-5-hydroxy-6-metoxy-1,4-benzoquinol methylase
MQAGNSLPDLYAEKQEPYSSHTMIKKWLLSFPPGSRILDIGTAAGTMARICAGSGLLFFGIEANEQRALIARPYYQGFFQGDLESAPDDVLGNFDIILCADILEHTAYPGDILKRLVNLQNPGAFFIISVPNIAHIWIRLNLLLGNFNYTDKGILDSTHLRFFTRKTLLNLVQESGLSQETIQPTPIPLSLVFPALMKTPVGNFLNNSLYRLTRTLPTLFAYQLVIKAIKRI